METPKIFESEYRFCQILWEREPVGSTELVRLCRERLGWKKSTTYTVIRRLAERGVVKLENAVVTALVSQEQVRRSESRRDPRRKNGGRNFGCQGLSPLMRIRAPRLTITSTASVHR